MSFLKSIKYLFKPIKLSDPNFGELRFMYISNIPENSYWEARWEFKPTNTTIEIGLDGDETGPSQNARNWYLKLENKYEEIITLVKPELNKVFEKYLNEKLPNDIFSVIKLSGFEVENPNIENSDWDVSFETTGEKWLGIIIPFKNNIPQQAIVDM